jgi:CTP-dependent riboflavin kinase
LSKAEALLMIQAEIAQRGSIPSQDVIANRCAVNKSASRWLRQWERDGLISRQQDGRCKIVAIG